MKAEEDWDSIRRSGSPLSSVGMGVLRFTLLFGSAAIALALLAVPFLENQTRSTPMQASNGPGIDYMATGSISRADAPYTIRRSVLQKSPDAVCVIRQDGSKSGDC